MGEDVGDDEIIGEDVVVVVVVDSSNGRQSVCRCRVAERVSAEAHDLVAVTAAEVLRSDIVPGTRYPIAASSCVTQGPVWTECFTRGETNAKGGIKYGGSGRQTQKTHEEKFRSQFGSVRRANAPFMMSPHHDGFYVVELSISV